MQLDRTYNSQTFFVDKHPCRFEVVDRKLHLYSTLDKNSQIYKALVDSIQVNGEKFDTESETL